MRPHVHKPSYQLKRQAQKQLGLPSKYTRVIKNQNARMVTWGVHQQECCMGTHWPECYRGCLPAGVLCYFLARVLGCLPAGVLGCLAAGA